LRVVSDQMANPSPISRRFGRGAIAVLFVLTLGVCLPQKTRGNPTDKPLPWITKEWTHWTSDDCYLVLNNSPWALKDLTYLPSSGPGASYQMTIIQLRSALPIRQALLRQLQLRNRYDKMTQDKQREFNQQNALVLTGKSEGKVVVVISNSSTEPPSAAGNPNARGRESTLFGPKPPRRAALQLSNKTLVLPTEINKVNYSSTAINEYMNQFEYIFPRTIGGKPLYTADDSVVWFQLGDPLNVDQKTGGVQQQSFRRDSEVSFKITDLIYKGKIEY
jgi:hypothetical protein